MISVIIPYHSNKEGLAVNLAILQAQMVLPHKIIVIDTSKDKSGLEIVKTFNTNSGVPIAVECAQVNIYEAWNKGIDLAEGDDCFIINDDVLLPMNVIAELEQARNTFKAYVIAPDTPPNSHYRKDVDENFNWYAEPAEVLEEDYSIVHWMPGFAFMLTKECIERFGVFDLKYKIWWGDTAYQNKVLKEGDPDFLPIVKINKTRVYHYGGSSYKYKTKKVQKLIDEDRKVFESEKK